MVAARTFLKAIMLIALHLRSCCGKQIDIHARRCPVTVATIRAQIRPHVTGIVGVGVGRRNVRGANLRDRCRPGDRLTGRWHHRACIVHDCMAIVLPPCSSCGRCCKMLRLIAAPRVGVVVNPRVTSQLIRAAKALGASGELASVWLLAGMGTDVTSLVFQTVEGTVTERTLVWARQVLANFFGRRTGTLHQGRQESHGGSHCRVSSGLRTGRSRRS